MSFGVSPDVEYAAEALSVDSASFHTPLPITEKVRTRRFSLVNPFTWFNNDVDVTPKNEEKELESPKTETDSENEKLIANIMEMFKTNNVNEMQKVLDEEIEKSINSGRFIEEKDQDEYEYIDEFARVARKKSVRFDKTIETLARPFTPMFTSTPQNSIQKAASSFMSIENSTILTNTSITSAIRSCAPTFNYDVLAERSKTCYELCDISDDEEEEPIKKTFLKEIEEEVGSDEESAKLNCSATFVISPSNSSEEEYDEFVSMKTYEKSNSNNITDVFEDSNWADNSSLISMDTFLPEVM